MTTTPIRAAVYRAFGEPVSIEQLHLVAPRSGQVQVKALASAVCHRDIHFFDNAWGGKLPAVWVHEAAGVVEIVGNAKYRRGELLLDELITRIYTIDEINETIESVKQGQAVRNVILFDHADATEQGGEA